MTSPIDLRSDTITRPSPEMRTAMMEAEVGDDVFAEDPSAIRLEAEVSKILGKEAGVFVPSGTMGNQLAIKLHTQPGDEVLCEIDCHIAHYESGAPAALSGVLLRTIQGKRGVIGAGQIGTHVRQGHDWEATSRLLCIENTHNRAGGTISAIGDILAVCKEGRRHGLALHLDGARIWNATAATGITEKEYADPFDTVSVCLSKGLGAPVGSVLVGSAETIARARRFRKMFGGGMRQIGFLAAAGLHALEHQRERLVDDHRNARVLAEGIDTVAGLHIDPSEVDTNIVMFTSDDPASVAVGRLSEVGILMVPFGPNKIRATTHHDVSSLEIEVVISQMQSIFGRREN
jgi:threonine aldolase